MPRPLAGGRASQGGRNCSGMSPCLYRRSHEQGKEWQPSNTWRNNFLDRSSPPPPVGTMFEGHSFDAQCMCSIIGMMVADEKNDWSSSPCYVCRLVSPSGRLHNEDGLSNGSDFSTFGKDETAKLPDNTTREHWNTHTHTHSWMASGWRAPLLHEQVPDRCDNLDWQSAAAHGLACLERGGSCWTHLWRLQLVGASLKTISATLLWETAVWLC